MQNASSNKPIVLGHAHKFSFTSPVVVLFLFGVMFILIQLSGWHKSFYYDEPFNLRYGEDFLTKGPLAETDGQRMPVFALHALVCKEYGCGFAGTNDYPWRRFWIRMPTVIFTLALGLLIWHWCRKLYGPQAAMGALLLYAFNPTLLAHGKEITSDVITSFFAVLTVFLFWKWRTDKKDTFFYLTALSAGIAIVTKFSSILLFFILPLIVVFQKILEKNIRFSLPACWSLIRRSFIFVFLVWIVINSAYLFQGTFESTRSYTWQSRFYQNIAKIDFPMPLPRIFVRGLDYSHYIEENDQYGRGNNYILGHRHRKGRDYAFPIMILLKTPLAFFIILALAIAAWRSRNGPIGNNAAWLYLWIPFIVWLVFFSSLCDIQVGIRYLLPGYVFLIIFAGRAFQNISSTVKAVVLCAASTWYVLSVLSYHPHYMPYFNELIGDRINAYKYLADSNLDWENMSYYIKKWENDHPGIKYQTHNDAMTHPQAGFFLMPANCYVGVFDQEHFAWIREFKPLAHVAYSNLLIYVTAEELARALEKHPIPGQKK